MDELDHDGGLADCRRDALDRPVADVTGGDTPGRLVSRNRSWRPDGGRADGPPATWRSRPDRRRRRPGRRWWLGADTAPEQLGQFGMGGSTSTRPVRKTTTAAGGRPGRPPGAAGGRPRSRGDGTGTASLGRQPGGEQVVVDLSQRHGPHRRVGRGVVTPLQPQDPFGRRVQPMSGHQELHPGHLGHLLAGEHQGDLLGRLREPMEDGQSPGPGTARRGPGVDAEAAAKVAAERLQHRPVLVHHQQDRRSHASLRPPWFGSLGNVSA